MGTCTVYLLLMALHVLGIILNIRLLLSCFAYQDIFQNINALVIFQSILHLTLLALNADDTMKTFSNKQQLEQGDINGVLITTVSFFLVSNTMAMIAVEYPSVFCLKQSPSVRTAMFGTLVAGVSTVLFWTVFFILEPLCNSQIASTMACTLLLLIIIVVVWRICGAEEHANTRNEIKQSSGHVVELLIADNTSAFVATCFLVLVIFTLSLPAIEYLPDVQEGHFEAVSFVKKVLHLFAMCFGVGIVLPLIFSRVMEQIDGFSNEAFLIIWGSPWGGSVTVIEEFTFIIASWVIRARPQFFHTFSVILILSNYRKCVVKPRFLKTYHGVLCTPDLVYCFFELVSYSFQRESIKYMNSGRNSWLWIIIQNLLICHHLALITHDATMSMNCGNFV